MLQVPRNTVDVTGTAEQVDSEGSPPGDHSHIPDVRQDVSLSKTPTGWLALMADKDSVYEDLAESILEHAEAIARLDAGRADEAAYESTCADHVAAMRSLAAPHMEPQPDMSLVRTLKSRSRDFTGVFVALVDGVVQLTIDAADRQHKVKLLSRKHLENEEQDSFGRD